MQTVLGCYYHGHDQSVCPKTRNIDDAEWKESQKERQERTRKKREFTESLGIKYVEIYECEYRRLLRENPEMKSFSDNQEPKFFHNNKSSYKVTEAKIKEAVLNDDIFRAVQVDIHVPQDLHEKFSEFSPIFCTTTVPWDVIGDTMQQHWQDTQVDVNGEVRSFPAKRLCVGGMRASKILLSTPLLKYYMEKGLVVTRVYQVL